ncbi:hypothetical protein [Rossellomorea aquimaris]|uniref:hypothetical protein n=1 Tax=Rossellomorea aquimaris TaxID=189382 RepID=UPI001CFE22DC|nr:hypothetical protein [Rossellomorea aquimaris]
MNEWFQLLLLVVTFGFQYFLAKRDSVYWGFLIPAIFVVTMTYFVLVGQVKVLSAFLVVVVGVAFLMEEWFRGRKDLKKERTQELNKMKSQDI